MHDVAKHGGHREHHSFEEREYISPDGQCEVMVDIGYNGGVIGVYTYAEDIWHPDLAKFEWQPGRNPVFVHAIAPIDVYRAVREWDGNEKVSI